MYDNFSTYTEKNIIGLMLGSMKLNMDAEPNSVGVTQQNLGSEENNFHTCVAFTYFFLQIQKEVFENGERGRWPRARAERVPPFFKSFSFYNNKKKV